MADASDKPEIHLSFDRVLCPVHGEPLRAQWPNGYATLLVKLFERVAMREPFADEQAAYRRERTDGERLTDAEVIEALLDRKPLCCRVSAEEMLKAYEEAHKGGKFARKRVCSVCGGRRLGTPYRTQQGDFAHICFTCVCKQAQVQAERLN